MGNIIQKVKLFALGLVAGFSSAALGIGGGVIMVPGLVMLIGYSMHLAVGTSLAAIVPIAFVGIGTHYYVASENIKLVIAVFVMMGSIVGALFGAKLASKLSSSVLQKLFALLLVFTGLKFVKIFDIPTGTVSADVIYPLLIVLGLFAGSGSALFGIGGGVIMVPVLNLFFGLSMHEAVATSLTVILPTTLAGALFHRKLANIVKEALPYVIPTALVGAVLGAVFANSVPAATLKSIFGILLLACAVKMFLQKS